MIGLLTVIIVGVAAAFILSRSRRQHRPIGAFRSSSDRATFLALGHDPDDRGYRGDTDGLDRDGRDAGDAGDSGGGGNSGGDEGGGGDGGGRE